MHDKTTRRALLGGALAAGATWAGIGAAQTALHERVRTLAR